MVLFRQLLDPRSSTYTYLLADAETSEAVLIDPVFEQVRRDSALVTELGLELRYTLETHVHADHITGAWVLKQRLGSDIALAKSSGAEGADLYLEPGDRVSFGSRHLTVRPTPGHTDGCVTYVLDDESMAFTGDCLLVRGAGRTDFQQGNAQALYDSVHQQIFTLPDSCLLWPAHDYQGRTCTTVGEERRFNPRLGGERSVEDFVGYMNNLGLPHPKQIDRALPANLKCGKPSDASIPDEPDWAPLRYTFAGVWEVDLEWLEEHLGGVQILDVRQPEEYHGDLGHLPGARLIPLDQLAERTDELDRSRPVVAVCRSGGRSAQANVLLAKAGFEQIANLPGGMIGWRAGRRPVEEGRTLG